MKDYRAYPKDQPYKIISVSDSRTIKKNNNFDKKFNSLSNLPIFSLTSLEFIDILVSVPVNITSA